VDAKRVGEFMDAVRSVREASAARL